MGALGIRLYKSPMPSEHVKELVFKFANGIKGI